MAIVQYVLVFIVAARRRLPDAGRSAARRIGCDRGDSARRVAGRHLGLLALSRLLSAAAAMLAAVLGFSARSFDLVGRVSGGTTFASAAIAPVRRRGRPILLCRTRSVRPRSSASRSVRRQSSKNRGPSSRGDTPTIPAREPRSHRRGLRYREQARPGGGMRAGRLRGDHRERFIAARHRGFRADGLTSIPPAAKASSRSLVSRKPTSTRGEGDAQSDGVDPVVFGRESRQQIAMCCGSASVHAGVSSGTMIMAPLKNNGQRSLLATGEPVELARRFCIANRFYGSRILIGPAHLRAGQQDLRGAADRFPERREFARAARNL